MANASSCWTCRTQLICGVFATSGTTSCLWTRARTPCTFSTRCFATTRDRTRRRPPVHGSPRQCTAPATLRPPACRFTVIPQASALAPAGRGPRQWPTLGTAQLPLWKRRRRSPASRALLRASGAGWDALSVGVSWVGRSQEAEPAQAEAAARAVPWVCAALKRRRPPRSPPFQARIRKLLRNDWQPRRCQHHRRMPCSRSFKRPRARRQILTACTPAHPSPGAAPSLRMPRLSVATPRATRVQKHNAQNTRNVRGSNSNAQSSSLHNAAPQQQHQTR